MTTLRNLDGTDPKSLIDIYFWLTKQCTKTANQSITLHLNIFNECIVESAVSSAEDVEDKKRPLKHSTSQQLNFITSNGPHPLACLKLVDDMLTNYFGKE